jgi:hypothetical protein
VNLKSLGGLQELKVGSAGILAGVLANRSRVNDVAVL